MNRNGRITLTEQDLHTLVEDAVRLYITENDMDEGFWSNMKGAFKPVGQAAGQTMKNIKGSTANGLRQVGNKVGQYAQNASDKLGQVGSKVGQYAQNAANTAKAGGNMMKAGWQDSKLQGYKDEAVKALNDYLRYATKTVGAGDKTVQVVNNCISALNRNANMGKTRTGVYMNQFMRGMGMNN